MANELKFDKIFNIFSILYLPIAIILFVLNVKFGISYGDAQHSEYGEISSLVTFVVLLSYLILSIVQAVLFFMSKMQKSYFGIAFLNILLCCILIFLTFGGMLFLAFGFIIAAPILLILIILWLCCWIKAICAIKNKNASIPENTGDKFVSIVKKIFYFVLLISEIVFITIGTKDFYKREAEYNLRNISSDIQYKKYKKLEAKKFNNPIYKQTHEQFLKNSENFYNALVKMNININNKTLDEIAEEYKKEFFNIKKYAPILGEYTNVTFEKQGINGGQAGYGFRVKIFNNDSLLYNLWLENEDNEYFNFTFSANNEDVNYNNLSLYSINKNGEIKKQINYRDINP